MWLLMILVITTITPDEFLFVNMTKWPILLNSNDTFDGCSLPRWLLSMMELSINWEGS